MLQFIILFLCIINTCFATENFCSPIPTGGKSAIQAIKWYHDSAEKKAIYRQTYAMAAEYVNNEVKQQHLKQHTWGVILDIDETTSDNSWYYKKCNDDTSNEDNFEHRITIKEISVALPGVIDFIDKVHKLGGYVSMVTNRDGAYKDDTGNSLDSTINNLKKQHIHYDQVILARHNTDKNPRFNAVEFGKYDANLMVWSNKLPPHKVIAYVGDNIQDFPELKQDNIHNLDCNNPIFNKFGHGYFVLPNPIYGSWMNI